jgi:hypothetical protein
MPCTSGIVVLEYLRHAVTVYGVVSHKASHRLRPLPMYFASPSKFYSFLIHPPELSDSSNQQRDLVANQGGTWRKSPLILPALSYSSGSLT